MIAPIAKPRIPGATYRFQFNRGFTFKQATELVDYLVELGITDIYASPLFTSPPDSNHGYDVCDYNQINPILGTDEDWKELVDRLKSYGMGLLMDFVPNHMGTVPEFNSMWRDILEYGAESRYANFFDVDWKSKNSSLTGRALLPVLEDDLKKVLEQGLFSFELREGKFRLKYRDKIFPVDPKSYEKFLVEIRPLVGCEITQSLDHVSELLPKANQSIDCLKVAAAQNHLSDADLEKAINAALGKINATDKSECYRWMNSVINEQPYVLEFWRTGTRIANYRRFFDVDGLVGVTMERHETFRTAHALLGALVRAGQVTGLRLDHIDGLADPTTYLQSLQKFLAEQIGTTLPQDRLGFYVLVEKITMASETLRSDWPVFGTTGYEFCADVTGLLVDASQEENWTRIYDLFTSRQEGVNVTLLKSKWQIMSLGLSKEIGILGDLFLEAVQSLPASPVLTDVEPVELIKAVLVAFPVYRTYLVAGEEISSFDRSVIEKSINSARQLSSSISQGAFDIFSKIMLDESHLEKDHSINLFRIRFQQVSGPVMAKSFEDTTFFKYNRLVALNEVGGDPDKFGISPQAFHERNIERLSCLPHTMLATSTHDTKMSEDARARLAALSEIPDKFEEFLEQARSANSHLKTSVAGQLAPDANEEYLFYQILLASWPLEKMSIKAQETYTGRIHRHMLKAIRESKVHTRWDEPNEAWEDALKKFVTEVINNPPLDFTNIFLPFLKRVSESGMVNSLTQTLLKLTVPGVPDIFQGNECWQFILTDPDNRDQIDFDYRRKILESLDHRKPKILLKQWQDGGIKMFLSRTVLQFRRQHAALFNEGNYRPLKFSGKFESNCFGFSRELHQERILVLAPRLTTRVGCPPIGDVWKSTELDLAEAGDGRYRDLFTGKEFNGSRFLISQIFNELPFAVLVRPR